MPSLERLDDEAAREPARGAAGAALLPRREDAAARPRAARRDHRHAPRHDARRHPPRVPRGHRVRLPSHVEVFRRTGSTSPRTSSPTAARGRACGARSSPTCWTASSSRSSTTPARRFGAAVIAGVGVGLIADWTYVRGALATRRVHRAERRASSRATRSATRSSSASPRPRHRSRISWQGAPHEHTRRRRHRSRIGHRRGHRDDARRTRPPGRRHRRRRGGRATSVAGIDRGRDAIQLDVTDAPTLHRGRRGGRRAHRAST